MDGTPPPGTPTPKPPTTPGASPNYRIHPRKFLTHGFPKSIQQVEQDFGLVQNPCDDNFQPEKYMKKVKSGL